MFFVDQEASFNLNLMNLEGDQLQIPATEYNSKIVMPSGDFSKVCKELSQISENGKFLEISRRRYEHAGVLNDRLDAVVNLKA